jgi:alanine dehydrogenase
MSFYVYYKCKDIREVLAHISLYIVIQQQCYLEETVMLIGVPKEIKNKEFRVGMTPTSVREVVEAGHKVIVETGCGAGIGMDDAAYRKAGAKIIKTAEEIFAKAEMIVKVKEPQANERKMLREGQILFTYLHLAPDPAQTRIWSSQRPPASPMKP